MLTVTERALSASERETLTARLERARIESRLALLKTGTVSAAGCGVLLVLTLLASDAPWWVIVPFWSGMAALFTVWIGMPWRRLMRQQMPVLTDALRTDRASVTRIQAARVVEFEEVEDEGAAYAFEIDARTSFLLIGQEFYESDRFPNSDFSLVDILGTHGQPIDSLIETHGDKLAPVRVIPGAVKDQLALPEHVGVVAAPVDRVEEALREPRR